MVAIVGWFWFFLFRRVSPPHPSPLPTVRVLEKPNHQSGFIPRRQDEGLRVVLSKHSTLHYLEMQAHCTVHTLSISAVSCRVSVSLTKWLLIMSGVLEARRNGVRGPNLASSPPEALDCPTSLTPSLLLSGRRASSVFELYQKRVVTSPPSRMCFVNTNLW